MNKELAQPIRGIIPPLVTPLTENGQIDFAGLERLLEHVLAGGVHGVFLLGSTGEGPSLHFDRRLELIQQACRIVDGRVPVLACISDTILSQSIALSRAAADAGCDAVVAAPPYYFPLRQYELLTYFKQLVRDVPLPLVLYNMPAVVGLTIELDTVDRLIDQERVVGLKDSSCDLDYFHSLLQLTARRKDFSLMVGPEHLLSDTLSLGGSGGVTGGANILPRPFVALYEAYLANELEAVGALVRDIDLLGRIYSVGPRSISATISRIKSALALCEVCSDQTAAPIAKINPEERVRIESILEEMGLIRRPTSNSSPVSVSVGQR